MKTQDHVAAHVNGLKSSIHAVEVQLTILKQLISSGSNQPTRMAQPEITDSFADDEDEEPAFRSPNVTFEDDDSDEEPLPTKRATKAKVAAASFDDEDEDETEEPAPKAAKPTKAAKAPKLTLDDVNDACKERCARTNRADVLGILKKNFKVKSVTDLEPTDYAQCIKLLRGK